MAPESVGPSKPNRRDGPYDFVANLEVRSFVWQHGVALAFNQSLSADLEQSQVQATFVICELQNLATGSTRKRHRKGISQALRCPIRRIIHRIKTV